MFGGKVSNPETLGRQNPAPLIQIGASSNKFSSCESTIFGCDKFPVHVNTCFIILGNHFMEYIIYKLADEEKKLRLRRK